MLHLAATAGALWTVLHTLATALADGHEVATKLVSNVVYVIPIVAATGLAAMAAWRRSGGSRRLWLLLAASNLLWRMGELTWSTYELVLHRDPPSRRSPTAST